MSDEGMRTALLSPSLRASVERGDPLAIYRIADRMVENALTSYDDRMAYLAASATRTDGPEPDSSQTVTAHPQTGDSHTDGDDLDVVSHDRYLRGAVGQGKASRDVTGPAHGKTHSEASWSENDRLAFLARAQRIDPRERKP